MTAETEGERSGVKMKIKLLRAASTVKEIEVSAILPSVDIHRLSVDLTFEHFERNQTHLWPPDEDTRRSATKFKCFRRMATY